MCGNSILTGLAYTARLETSFYYHLGFFGARHFGTKSILVTAQTLTLIYLSFIIKTKDNGYSYLFELLYFKNKSSLSGK